jgi:hypothetical protein
MLHNLETIGDGKIFIVRVIEFFNHTPFRYGSPAGINTG